MAALPLFRMRQCVHKSCRFRFPIPDGSPEGEQCPRCGAETFLATEAFAGNQPKSRPAAGGPALEGLLDNIRSAFNVGAIFRTADGAGFRHLHLCGITATPAHRKVAKTALGAEESVFWSRHYNALDAVRSLKEEGYCLWALERDEGAQSIFQVDASALSDPVVLIVGNELAGIDPDVQAACHRILYIPMAGVKESLNVAVAFGIAAYHLRYGPRPDNVMSASRTPRAK